MAWEVKTLEDLAIVLEKAREHEHLEFKEAKNNFPIQKLIEYCVAFANEGGGQMIFGVSDKAPRQVVGTAAFENLEALKKQIFDALRFRVHVLVLDHPRGRVLVIKIPARGMGAPVQHPDGRYLARVGESLVAMSPDQLRAIFAETDHSVGQVSPPNEAHGYLCGPRVQKVRLDLELKPSHLVELIDFPSERLWIDAEDNKAELTAIQLKAFSELTGAQWEWLKHGDGMPYSAVPVYDTSWRRDLLPLVGADPYRIRVIIAPESMSCFVLHERSDHWIESYQFAFHMDFWNWFDDHGHIPHIWQCLHWLRHEIGISQSRILSKTALEGLNDGSTHPRTAWAKQSQRSDWFDDLFDLEHKYVHLVPAYKGYGPWFLKLQEAFKAWGSTEQTKANAV